MSSRSSHAPSRLTSLMQASTLLVHSGSPHALREVTELALGLTSGYEVGSTETLRRGLSAEEDRLR